jgi:hypothetical protein
MFCAPVNLAPRCPSVRNTNIPRSATAAIRYDDDAVLDAPALTKRGERIHVQWTATMLLDGERNVIGLSVVMQEVTRSKENG